MCLEGGEGRRRQNSSTHGTPLFFPSVGELIASQHLTILLQDEIFADFFNTFLNLPVFGQTPIFMCDTRQWYLWPELPCHLISKHKGLLNWLEKHRLPYFCKTNLCLHYLLCVELISFIRSPEAADMLRWKKADQWLLEKCIGGSRGMWRFRSFMQGMAGEELTKFWLAAERILGIDETDEAQQDLYVSLIQVLMATHLQEGSTVVTLCNTTIESLLKMTAWHPHHTRTRREVLSEMQKVALFKIESYWLPNFYIHCKLSMEDEPKCLHLLEEYEERLCRAGLPRQSLTPRSAMGIRKSSTTTVSYCSLKSKKEVWEHVRGEVHPPKKRKHKEGEYGHHRKQKSRKSNPAEKSANGSPAEKSTKGSPAEKSTKGSPAEKSTKGSPAEKSANGSPTEKSTKGSPTEKIAKSTPADKKHQHPETSASRPSSCHTDHVMHPVKVIVSDELPRFQSSPSDLPSSPLSDEVAQKSTLRKLRSSTPVVQFPSMLALKTIVKSPFSLNFLPWVLIADKCAGRPFREFLLHRNYTLEVHLLDLWHDLEDFLRMMLCSLGEGNILLRHVMGERICELYLTQSNNWHLPLKLTTLKSLQNLLPSGHVIPWVLKAQKEICKTLSFLYEEFLQNDDKMFLYYVSGKEKKPSEEVPYQKDELLRLVRRITESLHLSQALAGMRDFDLLAGEHWQLLGTQDLGMGGSVFMELEPITHKLDYSSMAFEELARLNPKLAVELLSSNFKEFCKRCPSGGVFARPIVPRRSLHWNRSSLSFMRKGTSTRKPLVKPRMILEVLQNPTHLDYFRKFLKMNSAEAPLLFWMAVEDIKNEANLKNQRMQINDCVRMYFFNSIPPEKLLRCDADIIREIPRAKHVTLAMLITAQAYVMKALEEQWFKTYQDLYPESDGLDVAYGGRSNRGSLGAGRTKRCWYMLSAFIRTVCRFRKAMSYTAPRRQFEEFLHRELKNDKENMSPQASPPTRMSICTPGTRFGASSAGAGGDDFEVVQVKRKIFSNRIVSVNFLVNDLHFYLEIEKFFHLADSVVVLAALGLYTEKDIAFLRSKVSTINKLFLNSDIPPKLRVNLTEQQSGQIRSLIAEGVLNRTLYHGAIISLFPVLLYFWKKYRTGKAMKGFQKPKPIEIVVSPPPPPPPKPSRKLSMYSGEDHPIIRFTLLKGIQLLLPQPKEVVESPLTKSSTGSLAQTRKSSSALMVHKQGERLSVIDISKRLF
ncbi:regulator of G-protein signaling protein-like isoform X2 [Hemicordylus capensis]|uniref:regulator of G-protein signaling protein-like isoform X2 n=1 Tax=Hemicordylus capensis TaxID=884348 RepID=UPI002303B881|nr:regulator of G-protein signaling protein-like isoform X2 [Hemicordylus capensis]